MAKFAGDSDDTVERRKPWYLVGALLCLSGILASVLYSLAAARGEAAKSRASFRLSASEVASTLQLRLDHEQDLAINERAYVLSQPDGTNADFVRWTQSVQLRQRYPELFGTGQSVIVTAAQLPAFAKRESDDPIDPRVKGKPYTVVPSGTRPYYCLLRRGKYEFGPPTNADICDGPAGKVLLAIRDSGVSVTVPFMVGTVSVLSSETPVYKVGMPTATVQQRRAAFLGWVGTGFSPTVILNAALQDRPNLSVKLRYHVNSTDVTFTSSHAQTHSFSVLTNLQDGWTVQTAGAVTSSSIWGNSSALSMLAAGLGFSVVVAALIFVLATSRERAMRQVRKQTAELRHQALHDALTGLPNRALIVDRIDQLLSRNRRNRTAGAAFFVDLDDFKNINDTLGHQAGDQLLVAVSSRMKNALRNADTIGRMGGDEFVVLIDGAASDIDPEFVATRLLEVMREPFELDGATMPLTVNTSIGIAIGDRDSGADLLRDADVALYQAKESGKNCYAIFHSKMQTTMSRRLDLEFDLRAALEGDQFRLLYQPIYDIDGLTLVGVEALLRWDHPRLGEVQPDEFIPILEQSSQILDVGRWVLHHACAQMAAWHEQGQVLDLSVNISGRQLDHDGLIIDVRDALSASGLDATSLILEITETTLMRNAQDATRRLRMLAELGIRIAVDDFGTGYSSLAYLQQFPVNCLKIDRAFTSASTQSAESRALITTLVRLGKDLGLRTLAEGVETDTEMDLLREARVDQAQGFLLARPLSPEALQARFMPSQVAS